MISVPYVAQQNLAHIILRFTKTPVTNWRCVRETEVPHTSSFE